MINYGISNTIVLDIPQFTTMSAMFPAHKMASWNGNAEVHLPLTGNVEMLCLSVYEFPYQVISLHKGSIVKSLMLSLLLAWTSRRINSQFT